ncbi:hypothetical protein Lalb_Chr06g0161441 [Lupinus albus]|uniref:Uncharacterized protein n=1 Tax=Lupinus albus TaxID=3870 RepID=A0A6A4QCW8_LUPAL|nr:hypothetical protein Lalb_Chr06g0161441 [Lupinus albus]
MDLWYGSAKCLNSRSSYEKSAELIKIEPLILQSTVKTITTNET